MVLAAGLAAAPLAAAEPGHDDGPHPEHQSPHMKNRFRTLLKPANTKRSIP